MASTAHHNKRTIKDVFGEDIEDESTEIQRARIKKSKRFDPSDLRPDSPPLPPATVEGRTELSKIQIKNLMETTKRQIEERRKQLHAIQEPGLPAPVAASPGGMLPVPQASLTGQQPMQLSKDYVESVRKVAEAQARIQQQFSKSHVLETIKSIVPGYTSNSVSQDEQKPKSVILSKEGQIVDATGKAIQMNRRMPTLKANIRAKKVEQFKTEKSEDNLEGKGFFDPRVSVIASQRNRRLFKFHEQGKFERMAQQLRAKENLERLKNEIASVAKKTGISSATKIAMLAPHKDILREDPIPDIEWWDALILPNESYNDIEQIEKKDMDYRGITNLIEHPAQVKVVQSESSQASFPIFLTRKERKKIRRQKRREAETEKQEKVRLGLIAAPEPKVKLSNLMRVLGNDAVQDPTKVEAHVRKQMVQRQRAHEAANAARKLTPDQRRDKKLRKLKEDTNTGCHVSVYRLYSLNNQSKRYKVDINAQQLLLTGCVVMFKDFNLVVVEGGPKALKKYNRLMLHRIKWNEDVLAKEESSAEERRNKCLLVWEGQVKEKSFNDWRFKSFQSEIAAREHMKKYGVEHYWDLAHSLSIIEGEAD